MQSLHSDKVISREPVQSNDVEAEYLSPSSTSWLSRGEGGPELGDKSSAYYPHVEGLLVRPSRYARAVHQCANDIPRCVSENPVPNIKYLSKILILLSALFFIANLLVPGYLVNPFLCIGGLIAGATFYTMALVAGRQQMTGRD